MRGLWAVLLVACALCRIAPAMADNNITVYGSGPIAISDSRQLTAYVPLTPNTVTWTVNGIIGGNAVYGTVSATGLYQSPVAIPSQNAVTVAATSTAFPAKSGSIVITITQTAVQLWSSSPTKVGTGAFTLSLNGANFTPQSQVTFGGAALAVTYVSPTSLTVKCTATAAQVGTKVALVVTNPGLGGTSSTAVNVAVAASGTTSTPPSTGTPTSPTPPATPTVTVALSPQMATLAPYTTQQFTATVSGTTNLSVTYSVNGSVGGNATVGTISGSGLYTAPSTAPSAAVTISVASVAATSAVANATVTIQGPPDPGKGLGTANLAAARFLEQATFGPTAADIANVNQNGVNAWLAAQFAMPETPIVNPGGMLTNAVQQQYLSRMTTANDQLRQRVAYALSQFIVVSINKNIYPDQVVPYLQILSADAFGNYRTLLGDISVSSQMGKYLDMVNSTKPGPNGGANENYAREIMQLFSIGLYQLNPDGTQKRDVNNQPIVTYVQKDVSQVALAFTGWTYQGPSANNFENFAGPLQPEDVNHDMTAKSFLGCNLPASQTTVQDMGATLDCIFNHPNVGPFVATRLIQNMVTSNPSAAYVGRVAAAFNDDGTGVRGNMKAVVQAILTDPEARNDAAPASAGRLKDPMQHIAAFVRALGGKMSVTNGLPWEFDQMAEAPLNAPSVFGFYSPLYRVPGVGQVGPEFQIYTGTDSVLRANMFWGIITNPATDFTIDTSPFVNAANPVALIDAVDQKLLYGRMPASMRQSIANAIAAQSDATSRWQAALYLATLSGYYATQY